MVEKKREKSQNNTKSPKSNKTTPVSCGKGEKADSSASFKKGDSKKSIKEKIMTRLGEDYKVVKMGKNNLITPKISNNINIKLMTRNANDTNDTNDAEKKGKVTNASKALRVMGVTDSSEKSPHEMKVTTLEILQDKGLLQKIIAIILSNKKPLSYSDLDSELDSDKNTIRKTMSRNKGHFKVADKDGKNKLWDISDRCLEMIKEKYEIFKKIQEKKKEREEKKKREKKEKQELYNEICKLKENVKPERKGIKSLYWDVGKILEFNDDIGKTLLENPNKFISLLKETYVEDYDHRFYNLPSDRILSAEEVRKEHIDELVEIRGRVVSLSSVRPVVEEAKYECPSCGTIITLDCSSARSIRKPYECSCGRKKGFKLLKKVTVDRANIIIEDIQEKASNPHTERLKGYVKEDLTKKEEISTFYPGNEIRAVGIVEEKPIYKYGSVSTQLDIKLQVMDAEHTEKEVSIENIEKEEIKEIKEIAERVDKEGMEVLSKSFAPSVFGYDKIKKALILQICNRRNEHSKDKVRNKSNILLMGDPGVSKSVLGEFAVRVSPGGRRGAGGTASTVGLTASVVKEDDDLGGWRVEPGAYALAKDIFFLDELNNIGEEEEQSRLQEGMSEQVITVDKANVHAKLKVYAGLLAAANPIGGHFDTERNYVEQFDIPSPILNRFDTIFVMKDEVDKEKDRGIARKMINREKDSIEAEYEEEILKKYFVYVKSLDKPEMTKEVEKMLEEIYTGERKNSRTKDLIINPRLLESLIRMIKASARTRLSKKVEKKDVIRALKILAESQYSVNEYDKFKEKEERDSIDTKVREPLEIIKEKRDKLGKLLPIPELEEEGVTKSQLDKLKKSGEIYYPKDGYIQMMD